MEIHPSQSRHMSRLERGNAELRRNRLAEVTAIRSISSVPLDASQFIGHATPTIHGIVNPPGIGGNGNSPPDDAHPDDDDESDGDHNKKKKQDRKNKKKKKRDSSSSSSSIGISKKDLL